MPVAAREIWLRVANGVAILSGRGRAVWNEPPAIASALRELLSVVPLTHAEIALEVLRHRQEPAADWRALLSREGDWAELLRETVAAVADAASGRAAWGFGLPNPADVAQSLGDASDRGLTKAGILLASFLQAFREARLDFVAVDLTRSQTSDKVIAPVFRNAQMYGWKRVAIVLDAAANVAGADVRLAGGDALPASFWNGDANALAPERETIYGEIPSGIDAAAIVAAGRNLERWRV